jgi:hypothetical protein
VWIQGGAGRRCGTAYIKTAQGTTGKAILIPFIYAIPSPDNFSTPEVYVVELTNNAIRVINTYTGTVSTPTATASSYETGSAYATSALDRIQYSQSADTMWLVSPGRKPQKLVRTEADTFEIRPYDWITGSTSLTAVKQHPFLDANVTATTIAVAAANENVGTTATLTSSVDLFQSGHVGAFFKLTKAAKTGTVRITSVTDATTAVGKIWNQLEATLVGSNTTNWEEAAWSDYRGWPRAIGFFESRLVMGGTTGQPDTLRGSKSYNYDHFMAAKFAQDASADTSGIGYFGAAANTDPYGFTLNSRQVNEIQWIDSKRTLMLGTSGSEWDGASTDSTLALGSLTVSFRDQTAYGSNMGQPAKNSDGILFAQRDGRGIRELLYDYNSDSYSGDDLAMMADHLIDKAGVDGSPGKIQQVVWQASHGTLWCRTTKGYLFGITRDRKTQVAAAFPVELGGYFNKAHTQTPWVTGMCVVPSSAGTGDDLWVAVWRFVAGSLQCFIERMEPEFRWASLTEWGMFDDPYDRGLPYFSDAAKVYDSPHDIGGATQANPVVLTVNNHGFSDGDQVRITGVLGMTELNGNTYTIANKTANTFELQGVDGRSFGAYTFLGYARKLVTSATGFLHLQGEYVSVLADGYLHDDVLVDGLGHVSLNFPAASVICGLPFTNRIKIPAPEAGSQTGSATGSVQKMDRAALKFYQTGYAKFGTSSSNLQELNYRDPTLPMDTQIPLYEGRKYVNLPGNPERDPELIIESDKPVPMNVASITIRGDTRDL